MSTPAFISKLNDDGSVTAVRLDWDGYLSEAGEILVRYYTDPDKVDDLISRGRMHDLAPEIGGDESKGPAPSILRAGTKYENYHQTCTFYARDSGDDFEDVAPEVIPEDQVSVWLQHRTVGFRTYQFRNGSWYYYDRFGRGSSRSTYDRFGRQAEAGWIDLDEALKVDVVSARKG